MLETKFWSGDEYQPLRQRLKTVLAVPEVQYEGDFVSIAPKDTSAEDKAKNVVVHVVPLGKGTPIPQDLADLKYKCVLMELRSDVTPTIHPAMAVQLLAGVPMLIAGVGPYVRQMVSDLEASVGEKLHLGDIVLYERDADMAPMAYRGTTVALLKRGKIDFLVCLPNPVGLHSPVFIRNCE